MSHQIKDRLAAAVLLNLLSDFDSIAMSYSEIRRYKIRSLSWRFWCKRGLQRREGIEIWHNNCCTIYAAITSCSSRACAHDDSIWMRAQQRTQDQGVLTSVLRSEEKMPLAVIREELEF